MNERVPGYLILGGLGALAAVLAILLFTDHWVLVRASVVQPGEHYMWDGEDLGLRPGKTRVCTYVRPRDGPRTLPVGLLGTWTGAMTAQGLPALRSHATCPLLYKLPPHVA